MLWRLCFSKMKIQRGFTLLEIVIVVAMIALIMGLSAYVLSRQLPGQQLRNASKEIAAELRFTKTQALISGQPQTFSINVQTKEWAGPKKRGGTLPSALEVIATTARNEQPKDDVAAIKFFPDGASTGGRIILKRNSAMWAVNVNWLTGNVTVDRHQGNAP
jgi:general secretion pathway protein H